MSASQAAHGGRRVYLDSPYVTLANGLAVPSGSVPVQGAVPLLLNSAGTLDMRHGNLEGVLLPSAARTANTEVAGPKNRNARGVLVMLAVSAASGTGGLQVRIVGYDPAGGARVYLNAPPSAITATGEFGYLVYPGAAAITGFANASPLALPLTWGAFVIVGDSSSYTYSLSYSLIV